MFIKLLNQNLYLGYNLTFTPEKTFFKCSNFKVNTDGTKSFFICNKENDILCLSKDELKFSSNIKNLVINDNNNILTSLIGDEIFTFLNFKNTCIYLEQGFNINQQFEIEYTFLDREALEGNYGMIYRNPRLLDTFEEEVNNDEVSKIFFDNDEDEPANDRIVKYYNVVNYFKGDIIAKNFLILPKKFCGTKIEKNWNFSTFQIIYDCCMDYKIIIENHKRMAFKSIFNHLKNILNAVIYLNEKDLVHLDIKFDNIVIDKKDGLYKLIDLDFVTDRFYDNCMFIFNNSSLPILYMLSYDNKNRGDVIDFNFKNCSYNTRIFFETNVAYFDNLFSDCKEFGKKVKNEIFLGYDDYNKFIGMDYKKIPMFAKFKKCNFSKKELFLRHDLVGFGLTLCSFIKNLDRYFNWNSIFPFLEMVIIQKEHTPTYEELLKNYDLFLDKLV